MKINKKIIIKVFDQFKFAYIQFLGFKMLNVQKLYSTKDRRTINL